MNSLMLGAKLSEDLPFEIYEGYSKKYGGDLLVKVYKRSDTVSAECLLKEALRRASLTTRRNMVLIDVVLTSDTNDLNKEIAVNFVLRANQIDVQGEELRRSDDDKQPSRGLQDYGPLELILNGRYTKVYESTQQNVIVKSHNCRSVFDVNAIIQKAFIQAIVAHERICRIIDVCLDKENPRDYRIRLHLVTEKMDKDLEQDVDQRMNTDQFYTEEELLRFLCDVTEALLHAKTMVSIIQCIPHSNLEPTNIFIIKGRYKIGEFGSAWINLLEFPGYLGGGSSENLNLEEETNSEIKRIDHFAADVHSLGLITMKMAALNLYSSNSVADLQAFILKKRSYSKNFITLLSKMTHANLSCRLKLDQVSAICKELLDTISQTPGCVLPLEKESDEDPELEWHTSSQGPLFRFLADEEGCYLGRLQTFDVKLMSWGPPLIPSQEISVDTETRYAFIDEKSAIVCGSKRFIDFYEGACQIAGTEVFRVKFEKSIIKSSKLPSFPQSRIMPGLYVHQGVAFAFGGKI